MPSSSLGPWYNESPMIEDLVGELSRVADAAGRARDRIQAEQIQAPLTALRGVCDEVHRAWSGSNLGYHASVYFAGLTPPPAGVGFSPEWGLMDRWPTHQPHPGWQPMDYRAVVEQIYERAGRPDRDAITRELSAIRDTFVGLRETAMSILHVALSGEEDSFLKGKLRDIQQLSAPEPAEIESSLVSSGAGWSRDSTALTQGLRAAPHQSVMAFHLSGSTLARSIGLLEQSAREAASHLRRRQARNNRRGTTVGANVFIGHGQSHLWRALKDFIEDRLGLTVLEFNSQPVAGKATTTRLSELLDASAFAFVIMTGEDEQPDGKLRARENVVHEAGLFQGRLGFERAIVLLEEGCEEFSNIHGLNQIRFPKGNIAASFEEVRAVLEREGLIRAARG